MRGPATPPHQGIYRVPPPRGLISDKTIGQQSGLLNLLTVEDLVLADKGFLIQDLVPDGVSVNISPFLINGAFTESEARATKAIAKCRIHACQEGKC